jgi:hypothetical protein
MSDERRALTDGPFIVGDRWGADATHVPGLDGEDPYGLMYGDWQDPFEHADDMCTGCDMCRPWEGRPYEQVRDERRAAVAARRARERDAAGS